VSVRVSDGTRSDRTRSDRAWVWRYLIAAHAARVFVALFALYVAARTTEEIPVAGWLSVTCAAAGVAWTLGLALSARPLDRLLTTRPRLVFVDSGVLVGLSLIDKPWDAMVAVPFGAYLLLVVYGKPRWILGLIIAMASLQYLPKIILEALDWRYAELVPPTSSAEWLTAYVGPVFAGTICWALCVLVAGVTTATRRWDEAQRSLTEAHVRRENARARRALADRLHETISQVARAIPLMLDSAEPDGMSDEARRLRAEITRLSLRLRPQIQVAARALRDGGTEPPA
jgi:hypothetical protein